MTKKRIIDSGLCYFVTTVTFQRQLFFKDPKAAWFFIHTLGYHKFIYEYLLYAYVVMPDHIHAIVQPDGKYTISNIMHHVKGTFSRKYNEFTGHKGHVWQEGFYDQIIRGPGHIRKTINYTHQNPVRANIVSSVDEYPFSSYWPLQGRRTDDRHIVDHFE